MRYWKCTVCGYIHEGDEPPEKCPVCGAPASKFTELTGPDAKEKYDAYMAKMGNTLKGVMAKAEQKKKDEAATAAAAREVESDVKAAAAAKMDAPPLADEAAGKAEGAKQAPAEPGQPNLLFRLMAKNHSHPMAVHTPNGILPMTVFFVFLSTGIAFTKWISAPPHLGGAALYSLIFVALFMPAVLFTGWVEWHVKYGAARTRVFVTKIICGCMVTGLAAGLVVWNLVTGGAVASLDDPSHWLYLLVHLLMLAAAAYAGHLGGRLVFKE